MSTTRQLCKFKLNKKKNHKKFLKILFLKYCREQNMLNIPNIRINVDTPNRDLFLKDGLKNTPICEILGKGSYGTVIKAVYKGN